MRMFNPDDSLTQFTVLGFGDVLDGSVKIVVRVEYFAIATFSPGSIADEWGCLRSQRAGAVGLELVAGFLRRRIGRNNDVNVIRSRVDGEQMPTTMLAVFPTGMLNGLTIVRFKQYGLALHLLAAPIGE